MDAEASASGKAPGTILSLSLYTSCEVAQLSPTSPPKEHAASTNRIVRAYGCLRESSESRDVAMCEITELRPTHRLSPVVRVTDAETISGQCEGPAWSLDILTHRSFRVCAVRACGLTIGHTDCTTDSHCSQLSTQMDRPMHSVQSDVGPSQTVPLHTSCASTPQQPTAHSEWASWRVRNSCTPSSSAEEFIHASQTRGWGVQGVRV